MTEILKMKNVQHKYLTIPKCSSVSRIFDIFPVLLLIEWHKSNKLILDGLAGTSAQLANLQSTRL